MRRFFVLSALLFVIPLSVCAQFGDDFDGDGIPNVEEDRDGDGVVDEGETDPLNADSDRGGEADGAEIRGGRNPADPRDDMTYDLDEDGLSNGAELNAGTDPKNPDTDSDGATDPDDPFPLDEEYTSDADSDGLPDEYEEAYGFSPEKRSDADEDLDGDGLSNATEFRAGTEPDLSDTDHDGVADGEEVEKNSNPLENPCLFYAGPGEPIHDLEGHWSRPFVTLLHETTLGDSGPRIVNGYATDLGFLFRPDQNISRFELLKIVVLSNCIPVEETSENGFTFTDVPRVARPREEPDRKTRRNVIYSAYTQGIIGGFPDGSFRPDAPVTRAEALKILFLASMLPPIAEESPPSTNFTDVPADSWFAPYVIDALSYGFIEGFHDPSSSSGQVTFRPGQHLTRAEAAKIVLEVLISNPKVNGYVIPTEDLP